MCIYYYIQSNSPCHHACKATFPQEERFHSTKWGTTIACIGYWYIAPYVLPNPKISKGYLPCPPARTSLLAGLGVMVVDPTDLVVWA